MPSELMAHIKHDLSILDDYYIPVRYPDALPGGLPDGPPGQHEASEALVVAQDVMQAVVNYLSL